MATPVAKPNGNGGYTVEQFVLKAIRALRNTEKSAGIHTVYSGFNAAFREQFPSLNPVEETNKLAAQGRIQSRPCKGGVLIYLPGELASGGGNAATAALNKIMSYRG